jgi:hypothetical protein
MKRLITLFWRWWYKIYPSPSKYTRPEALAIARKYNLEYEVIKAMDHGCTPDEALQEWDIYPYDDAVVYKHLQQTDPEGMEMLSDEAQAAFEKKHGL